MSGNWTAWLALAAALGSGLVGGLFFAFSTFVMQALGRLPPADGIAAMQAINVTVKNLLFFLLFFGTGALSLLSVLAAFGRWQQLDGYLLAGGGLVYLLGVILVTALVNVPMNEALAKVAVDSGEGVQLWQRYLARWTQWNHLRTLSGLAAAAAFTLAFARLLRG